MSKKIVNTEELESRLRKVLDSVTDADVRHFIVGHLFRYVDNMQTVQYIPTALRLQYYACTYVIFDYLRSNGQLDRTERIFDKEACGILVKHLECLARNCMMKTEEIKNDIVRQLENNGLKKGDREQRIKLLLTHAYVAVRMYWAMSPEDRFLASQYNKKFRRSFSLRNFLKERKTNSRKSSLPPAPPILKKEYKEKTDKNTPTDSRVKRTLKVRKEEFWNELLTYEGKYDRQTLLKFYYYWAEQVSGRRKMRKELETSWETAYRLAGWSMRSYQANDETATLRLERAKAKSTQKESSLLCTAEREEANERLFRQIEENKKGAVSREEWLKMKRNSQNP